MSWLIPPPPPPQQTLDEEVNMDFLARQGKLPLISIKLPNYNYGKYLPDCLESILSQTYPNIEVFFRDNNSSDDSYEIALSYREKFRKKGYFYSVSLNKYNFGSEVNTDLISRETTGDFVYTMGTDDLLKPDFMKKCIMLFMKYPNLSTVITHRDDIDENGSIKESPPFYNTSCIVDGESQAAVYMMSGIAIPTQRIFDPHKMTNAVLSFARNCTVAGDWYSNFLYALVGDVAYIKEPLCQYRIHSSNETTESEKDFLGIFEHYFLINEFAKIGNRLDQQKIVKRKTEAIIKLGSMCIRYAIKMLDNKCTDIALKYLHLAPVFDSDIIEQDLYKELLKCIGLNDNALRSQLDKIKKRYVVSRTISYDPPDGFMPI
jgi:glycosyltransferase involved in cell wall biosynthesis